MRLVFNKLKICRTHFLHFGHGIGPIEMEFKKGILVISRILVTGNQTIKMSDIWLRFLSRL